MEKNPSATIQEQSDFLDDVCRTPNKSYHEKCASIRKSYENMFITSSEQMLNPVDVCKKADLCEAM